jgi:hypothetical protein
MLFCSLAGVTLSTKPIKSPEFLTLTTVPEVTLDRGLYRFRFHPNNKIESTVNTQLFSFSTPPSTVNSQQSRTVQPELILNISEFSYLAGDCFITSKFSHLAGDCFITFPHDRDHT